FTSLAMMRIDTPPPSLPGPRADNEEVVVVGEDAEEDRVDDAVNGQLVQVLRCQRVGHERIGQQDGAQLAVIATQEDKVPRRKPTDIVGLPSGKRLAHVAIEVGRAQSGEDRDAAVEVAPDQLARQVLHADGPAEAEKLEEGARRGMQSWRFLGD